MRWSNRNTDIIYYYWRHKVYATITRVASAITAFNQRNNAIAIVIVASHGHQGKWWKYNVPHLLRYIRDVFAVLRPTQSLNEVGNPLWKTVTVTIIAGRENTPKSPLSAVQSVNARARDNAATTERQDLRSIVDPKPGAAWWRLLGYQLL